MKPILFLFSAANLFAADRHEMLSEEANAIYHMIISVSQSLTWVLALVPAYFIAAAVIEAVGKENSEIEMKLLRNTPGGGGLLRRYNGILARFVISAGSFFIMLGIFAHTYAGGGDFLSTWNQLVVSFWRDTINMAVEAL